jgi:hypothetical protein
MHQAGLFENGGISALRQSETSEKAVAEKFQAAGNQITLPELAAPSQSTVDGQELSFRGAHCRGRYNIGCLFLILSAIKLCDTPV